jgi:predicted HTH domain antitoxin
MTLDLPIPASLSETLRTQLTNLPKAALEGVALEGYRQGILSLAQVSELLDLPSRWAAQEFLEKFGCWPDYEPATLHAELSPLRP